jgi:hypothetical protein
MPLMLRVRREYHNIVTHKCTHANAQILSHPEPKPKPKPKQPNVKISTIPLFTNLSLSIFTTPPTTNRPNKTPRPQTLPLLLLLPLLLPCTTTTTLPTPPALPPLFLPRKTQPCSHTVIALPAFLAPLLAQPAHQADQARFLAVLVAVPVVPSACRGLQLRPVPCADARGARRVRTQVRGRCAVVPRIRVRGDMHGGGDGSGEAGGAG